MSHVARLWRHVAIRQNRVCRSTGNGPIWRYDDDVGNRVGGFSRRDGLQSRITARTTRFWSRIFSYEAAEVRVQRNYVWIGCLESGLISILIAISFVKLSVGYNYDSSFESASSRLRFGSAKYVFCTILARFGYDSAWCGFLRHATSLTRKNQHVDSFRNS